MSSAEAEREPSSKPKNETTRIGADAFPLSARMNLPNMTAGLREGKKSATIGRQMPNIGPRGRRKGYTKNRARREEIMARKPAVTLVHGTVGQIRDLYRKIDEALEAKEMNWVMLAEQIPVSRQYLSTLTEREEIPVHYVQKICAILDLEIQTIIEPVNS